MMGTLPQAYSVLTPCKAHGSVSPILRGPHLWRVSQSSFDVFADADFSRLMVQLAPGAGNESNCSVCVVLLAYGLALHATEEC